MHKISVIMPVYLAENTLDASAGSVLGQTYEDLELILVDDGSPDASGELCDRIAQSDARVRVIHLPEVGVSEARNAGIEACSGAYVTFVDSDDALEPDFLETMLAALEKSGADISGCGFSLIREGKQIGSRGCEEEPEELIGQAVVTQGILRGETRVWSRLFTREGIGENRFVPGLTIGEDMLFVLSCIREDTRFVRVPKPLYRYTVNPLGAMEQPFVPSYTDQVLCWRLAGERIRKNFPDLLEEREQAGRLAALRLTGACLLGSKLARLGRERKHYPEACFIAQQEARELLQVPGVKEYLPQGYPGKAFLLAHFPAAFYMLLGFRR